MLNKILILFIIILNNFIFSNSFSNDQLNFDVTEIEILDGATVTTAELNLIDGGTSATSTTLAAADRFLCNDNGSMKQVSLTDLVTFLEDGSTSGFDVDGGTY